MEQRVNTLEGALAISEDNVEFRVCQDEIMLQSSRTIHMGESFRINPEFRILRLTIHRKSASKC